MKMLSCIQAQLMRRRLFKGTLLGGLGLQILLFGAIFLPKEQLLHLGLPLYIISFGLIAWGLLPYQKLRWLEKNPDALLLSDTTLEWHRKNRRLVAVPLQDIKSIYYRQDPCYYGISIETNAGQKFFLSYFSKHSFNQLKANLLTTLQYAEYKSSGSPKKYMEG